MKYNSKEIEEKYRKEWEKSGIYKADDNSKKPKYYCLNEFPYPSGIGIHVGHIFTYIGGDVYARFKRMQGLNVLFPMGWDAFGLPAENFAIKMKKTPQLTVPENIAQFKKVMIELGLSFDWSREVNTTDPSYYKWTQWIFIKLFEKGLAFKDEKPINWCPSCKIGLADEEVVAGKCERCGTETEKRNINQWVVKITDYADRLIDGLQDTDFIEKVKAAQINWINRSEGINFKHKIKDLGIEFEVYDSVPQTFMAQTFFVIAPEHPLVEKMVTGTKYEKPVMNFVASIKKKKVKDEYYLDKENEGVFTGRYVENYCNTGRDLPIWVASYAVIDYGTGIVGCSAHDERDFAFAKKYGIPLKPVLFPKDKQEAEKVRQQKVEYREPDGILEEPIEFKGMRWDKAREPIIKYIVKNGFGRSTTQYHLRDWIFSRQHYWGEPIPMVNCPKCGWVPVDEKDLPVILPEVEHYQPTDTGESPLAKIDSWVNTTCPKCKGSAKRETDTMPNWAGSDWYFIRYLDPHNTQRIADISKQKYWLPIDVYIGGDEHNTLHLLYSRFINQFLYDLGVVPVSEPYKKRVSHGVILGPNNQRMSKSRGNVIVPKDIIEKVGADTTRTYLMFMGPFDATMAWNGHSLMGVRRFYDRVYEYITENIDKFAKKSKPEAAKAVTKTIKEVGERIENFQYNTAIAKLMELINFLEKMKAEDVGKNDIENFVLMLAPFGPFVSEQLWKDLGHKDSVHTQMWPKFDEGLLSESVVDIPVQVNGKVKGRITISVQLSQEEVQKEIMKNESIVKCFDDKTIKKVVYISGKIVNVVI